MGMNSGRTRLVKDIDALVGVRHRSSYLTEAAQKEFVRTPAD